MRIENFHKLEKLWQLINQKYYLHFSKVGDESLKDVILNIIKSNIDGRSTLTTKIARSITNNVDGSVDFEDVVGSSFTVKKELPYSTFLKEIQNRTNIPIKIAHAAFAEYFKTKTVPDKYFSKQTLLQFVAKYREWYITTFAKRYSYEKIDVLVNDPLREADGTPKKTVLRTDIGVLPQGDIESGKNVFDNYLYDACCYDSPLERENIVHEVLSNIAEVEVFGKIPKRTVRIPTYADGTYSPDFMYIVKRKDGKQQLNLIVETKDKTELDPEETRKIQCAQRLFEEIQKQVPYVRYTKQLHGEQMVNIIESIIKANND